MAAATDFNLLGSKGAALFRELVHDPALMGLWVGNERSGDLVDRSPYRFNAVAEAPLEYSHQLYNEGSVNLYEHNPQFYGVDYQTSGSFNIGDQAIFEELNFKTQFSLVAVVSVDTLAATYGVLFGKSNQTVPLTAAGLSWQVVNTQRIILQAAAFSATLSVSRGSATGVFSVNTPTLLVSTYDGGIEVYASGYGIRHYVNGVETAYLGTPTRTGNGTLVNTSDPVRIGAAGTSSVKASYYDGEISLLAVTKRLLEPENIRSLAFIGGFL